MSLDSVMIVASRPGNHWRLRRSLLASCIALTLPLVDPEGALARAETGATPGYHRPTRQRPSLDPATGLTPRDVLPSRQSGNRDAAFKRTHRSVHVVGNCDDSGPGSLREAAGLAVDGEIIDLQQLTCSTISLSTGQIELTADNITLIGPASTPGSALTIAGYLPNPDRVLRHTGGGVIAIVGLSIERGSYYAAAADAKGGCIYSAGDVELLDSSVHACAAQSGSAKASGGGIWSAGQVLIEYSAITANQTLSTLSSASGGGVYATAGLTVRHSRIHGNQARSNVPAYGGGAFSAGPLDIRDSTINENFALQVNAGSTGYGGGLLARDTVFISGSSIFNNRAHNVGGLDIVGYASLAQIINSTISGNIADNVIGGVYSNTPLRVSNSTIAFNSAGSANLGGRNVAAGLQLYYATTELQSSIIANNQSPGDSDLDGWGSTITGSDNLIIRSVVAPAGTLTSDPLLVALANNGGPTWTHALAPNSPAIAHGNNTAALAFDQRGVGFPRNFGSSIDIGAVESDGDRIFANGFE